MTVTDLALEVLLDVRERLIAEIAERARAPAARQFLASFHDLATDWDAFEFDANLAELPAVRWKPLNLGQLRQQNPTKFEDQLRSLERCLQP